MFAHLDNSSSIFKMTIMTNATKIVLDMDFLVNPMTRLWTTFGSNLAIYEDLDLKNGSSSLIGIVIFSTQRIY